jgi:DNA-binding CsgD family transcriptional regulator
VNTTLDTDPFLASRLLLERCDWSSLSARDGELLEHISRGLTDERIGEKLHLPPESVTAQVRRIVKTIGARNRTHAVALALRAGRIR